MPVIRVVILILIQSFQPQGRSNLSTQGLVLLACMHALPSDPNKYYFLESVRLLTLFSHALSSLFFDQHEASNFLKTLQYVLGQTKLRLVSKLELKADKEISTEPRKSSHTTLQEHSPRVGAHVWAVQSATDFEPQQAWFTYKYFGSDMQRARSG